MFVVAVSKTYFYLYQDCLNQNIREIMQFENQFSGLPHPATGLLTLYQLGELFIVCSLVSVLTQPDIS